MNPFATQPAEEIEAICKKLDNKSLAKFMETSKRVHNICYDLYLKRQEEYLEEEKREKEIIDKIKSITGKSRFLNVILRGGKLLKIKFGECQF